MKKKVLFIVPVLFGLFLASCGTEQENTNSNGGGSEGSSTTSENSSSGSSSSSSSSSSDNSTSSSSSSSSETIQYTITFKDEEDHLLESKKWDEGSIPSYTYRKNDTEEWDYTVLGWSNSLGGEVIELPIVSEDATYWAVVNKEKQQYTISFFNENGTQIKSDVLEYGAQPSCDYRGPEDTSEWDYTFVGWSTSKGGSALTSIPTVRGDANYYAVVSSNKQKYNVSFYNEEGTLLNKVNYSYGDTPSYTYTKTDTQEWKYVMHGWSKTLGGEALTSLPKVTADAEYYAVVTKTKQKYTITFDSRGGNTVSSITAEYGSSVEEPSKPTKDNYKFVAWSYDTDGAQKVTWPLTLKKNEKLYANWNEVVDIKAYLQSLMAIMNQDPYGYIPDTMKPDNSSNHVTNPDELNYNFENFTDVSSIKYGGFGEQWHMVIENIKESERFYSVISLSETVINSSVVLFNNYLDNNPGSTASHTLNEAEYTASIEYKSGVLKYTIQLKSSINIPLFGEVNPLIQMTYDISTKEKAALVELNENNAMRYVVSNDSYTFALMYGVTAVNRKAYFTVSKDDNDEVTGHIYEFVQFKDKDMVPSCADFYIDDEYTSVVGNKASGMPGFTGYINELYKTNVGKLLGYEVRESFTKWGISATYYTLWFNLNNITGINNVKAIKNDESSFGLGANNNHDIYLNNSDSIFEPTYNKKAFVSTSRKYDVEIRKQYFYGYSEGKLVEYETEIPMMFIQADHDGYTNYTDFHKDILSKSGIDANVNLSSTYVSKIEADHASLIDVFARNKDNITGDYIGTFIDPLDIE